MERQTLQQAISYQDTGVNVDAIIEYDGNDKYVSSRFIDAIHQATMKYDRGVFNKGGHNRIYLNDDLDIHYIDLNSLEVVYFTEDALNNFLTILRAKFVDQINLLVDEINDEENAGLERVT